MRLCVMWLYSTGRKVLLNSSGLPANPLRDDTSLKQSRKASVRRGMWEYVPDKHGLWGMIRQFSYELSGRH